MQYENDIRDRTKKFAVEIIKIVVELKKEGVEYPLRDQILRSGTSIGANVKEARVSSSKKELIRFFEIALRSCDETEYWFEVIEMGYDLKKEKFETTKTELKEITKVIAKIIINLKSQL
jgi:four helix bundle protein